ncbi:DUF3887 domain-containing protein [Gammaproteobacteria bacterium]|nr:DUF3887 domain-containing protein [Gammaproteobacteria bacterium]
MYTQEEKELALDLAYKLKIRDYESAYAMLSANLKSNLSTAELRQSYEQMIPQDWGEIDPIELMEGEDFPYLYVVLGGDVYSEAIIIDRFVVEDGQARIDRLEFGRP